MSNKNSNEEFLNRIVHLMQTDRSEDAPQDAVRWAKNIFRTRAAAAGPKKSLTQKVLAVLQMDLAPEKAVFGERSAGAAQTRQMLFGAGENSVDLRIGKTEKGGLNIHGQILGEGFTGAAVRLGEFETETNELSEFKFADVPAGNYDLVFQKDDAEIVIEDLNLA